MKPTLIVISTAVALSSATLPVFGEDQSVNSTRAYGHDKADRRGYRTDRSEHLGPLVKASKLLGAKVQNSQDDKLGHIEELAVDLESGRIVQVIVSVGGFLGIGDKLVALPPSSFTSAMDEGVRLEMDKASLKAAASFDLAKWEENSQPDRVAGVYRDYNSKPYFTTDPFEQAKASVQPARRIGYTEKASKLVGFPVKNSQDETIGRVDNLLVDLPAGRVVEVVVSAGGFLGVGDDLNAIPPAAFRYNAERNALLLNATKESLTQAPRFKSSEWPEPTDRASVVSVYRHYQVEPYFSTDADNTARNVRDREGATLTPLDQGTGEADVTLTRNIRAALRKQEGLSINAQNIKVITRDGKVTLRGVVETDEERRLVADIAARHGTAGQIDDQLEVKSAVNR